ncbi:MAG: 50S ribosomal protein L34e [Candidatus Aenigmarchaeota archaeon]|nr:50S ribosomal protein L34e [Candidatus Aenigmarchaeota archaeon]
MPRRALRSRSFRRRTVRTPGGTLKTRYEDRRPAPAKCAQCKGPLAGVPRAGPAAMRKLAKSSRRPNRPFGGTLCSACSRTVLKARAFALGAGQGGTA